MNEEEKREYEELKSLLYTGTISQYGKRKLIDIIEKQQKQIERLEKESIGDTKYERLLFSIRMLHFHHYVNDNQFIKMINKLSNENKGE